MSANDSFAAALRNLGGVHTLPKPQPKDKSAKKKRGAKRGESGSSRQETDGTGHSSATPDLEVPVGDPELEIDAVEVESPDLQPKLKKRKPSSNVKRTTEAGSANLGKSVVEVLDLDVDGEGGTRVAAEAKKPEFGKYSVKKVIGLISELPSDQDWEVMSEEGLVENFKEIGNLWGQVKFLSPFCFSFSVLFVPSSPTFIF